MLVTTGDDDRRRLAADARDGAAALCAGEIADAQADEGRKEQRGPDGDQS